MARNRYEDQVNRIASALKGQSERIGPSLRGGPAPAYATRFTPSMARDPHLTEQIAQMLDAKGLPDQANRVRQMGQRYGDPSQQQTVPSPMPPSGAPPMPGVMGP